MVTKNVYEVCIKRCFLLVRETPLLSKDCTILTLYPPPLFTDSVDGATGIDGTSFTVSSLVHVSGYCNLIMLKSEIIYRIISH